MKSDAEIRRDVEAELRFRPDIDERDIAATVNNSVVTLTGFTHTFLDKQRAEDAVKRVGGVAGVANDIEVRLLDGDGLTDPEITRAAVQAIRLEVPVVSDDIKVLVHHGHVTLEGKVEWHYLREFAERAVRRLRGVMGITNSISVQPTVKAGEIKLRIEGALKRSAELDANRIAVKVNGGIVTLTGYVPRYSDKYGAEAAAKRVVGVAAVANDIEVRPPSDLIRSDPDIARDAVAAIKLELPLHWEQVKLLVHDGRVALEGTLDWHDQRERAENAVRRIAGVLSVRNSIQLVRRADYR